jgi:hypothetical protein
MAHAHGARPGRPCQGLRAACACVAGPRARAPTPARGSQATSWGAATAARSWRARGEPMRPAPASGWRAAPARGVGRARLPRGRGMAVQPHLTSVSFTPTSAKAPGAALGGARTGPPSWPGHAAQPTPPPLFPPAGAVGGPFGPSHSSGQLPHAQGTSGLSSSSVISWAHGRTHGNGRAWLPGLGPSWAGLSRGRAAGYRAPLLPRACSSR